MVSVALELKDAGGLDGTPRLDVAGVEQLVDDGPGVQALRVDRIKTITVPAMIVKNTITIDVSNVLNNRF